MERQFNGGAGATATCPKEVASEKESIRIRRPSEIRTQTATSGHVRGGHQVLTVGGPISNEQAAGRIGGNPKADG